MVSAGGLAAAPFALSAAAKLAPHIPDPHGIHALSSVLLNPLIKSTLNAVEALTASSSGGKIGEESFQKPALEVLSAALGPLNLLRKRSSALMSEVTSSEAVLSSFGGRENALQVALALDLGARIIAGGFRVTASGAPFSNYTHSAAVSIVTATQLRVACIREETASSSIDENLWSSGLEAMAKVLGWQWPHFPDAKMATAVALAELQQYLANGENYAQDEESQSVLNSAPPAEDPELAQLSRNVAKKAAGMVEAFSKAGRTLEAITGAADTIAIALFISPSFHD